MKMQRESVEMQLASLECAAWCGPEPEVSLPIRMTVELCRTWLAVQDAPVGRVPRAKVGDLLLMSVSHDMAGQRVRLVRDGGE